MSEIIEKLEGCVFDENCDKFGNCRISGAPSLSFLLLIMTDWYNHSPNGKSTLFTNIDQIHAELNLRTNSQFPNIKLSMEEESMMKSFYHSNIRDICATLEYSLMVEYDAHFFLHRYFLKHGALQNDMKHLMLACIFLGSKTQNMHLTMDNFISKIANAQADLIIQMEVVVLAASDFRPPQFSPIPCLYGFVLDILPLLDNISISEYPNVSQKALDRLQISFMIDEIVLTESPSHVALACVLESDQDWKLYRENRLKELENVDELHEKIKRIQSKIKNYVEYSPESLKPIDRKIRLAKAEAERK